MTITVQNDNELDNLYTFLNLKDRRWNRLYKQKMLRKKYDK